MTPRATEVLIRPVVVTWEAGWTFPIKGIWYFVTHPFLWPLLRARLLPCAIVSVIVMVHLFLWTFLPQVAFCALFQRGGSAWVNGTFLVLSEGAAIVAILFEAFFVDEAQCDIFDAVLVERGREDLVAHRRTVSPTGETPVKRLGPRERNAVYAPFNFRQIFEFVLLLPLNFIPYAGVPLFVLLTGYRAGPLAHWRYFKFIKLKRDQRKAFTTEWRWKYTWFGTCSLMLQLIPVLNMLFLLTSTAGSALLVVLLEEKQHQKVDVSQQTTIAPETSDPPVQARDYGTMV